MRVVSPPHPIQTIPVPRRCPDRRCWKRSRCASPTSLSRCLGSPPPRVDRGPLHYPPCHDEKKREKKIVHYFFILKINDHEARRRIRVLLLEQSWWILCVHQSSPFRPVYYLLAIEQKEWEKKYCHGIQDKIDLLVITLKNCTMRKAQQGTRSAKRFYSLQWFFLSLSSSRYYWESIGSSSRAWHEEGEGIVIHLNDSYSAKTLWSSKSHSSTRKTTSCSFVNLKIKTPIKSILNLFQSTF